MNMLASTLLIALAATTQAPAAAPPPPVRAQAQVFVQIIQAAEVRDGRSDSPHQRTVRRDEAGNTQILLQFE